MELNDFMVVFEYKPGYWSWDCIVCGVSGDNSPDEENAVFEAEDHYTYHHTDLHPWDM